MNKILDQENNLLSIKAIEKEREGLINIGFIIKKYRAKRGITRQILANKSGISLRYLAQLESGKANPTISILKNISYSLNMTLSDMFFTYNNETAIGMYDSRLMKFSSEQKKKGFKLDRKYR